MEFQNKRIVPVSSGPLYPLSRAKTDGFSACCFAPLGGAKQQAENPSVFAG